jgi:hypothetical protein
MDLNNSLSFYPLNGYSPVSIRYNKIPKDQISEVSGLWGIYDICILTLPTISGDI